MKKFLKLGLGLTFAFIIMLSLTGCGNSENKPNNVKNPSQSENKTTGTEWEDIDETNCVAILKNKTGIDLSKIGSFTVTNAYGAYTKVADITGNYGSGDTKVSMFENFIKELLRVSNNSIWSTDVNNDTYKIEKVKEYTDYTSFYNWKIQGNEDLALNLSGGVYIENYNISYTFTDTRFNVNVGSYVAQLKK